MTKQLQERQERSPSAAFSATVGRLIAESTSHNLQMTEQQKRLVQNYFIGIDRALSEANNRSGGGYEWSRVDMGALAIAVRDTMRLGLDMGLPNHVHAIPYKSKNKILIGLIKGYSGKELLAMKYALDPPLKIVKELVCENDSFHIVKRSASQQVEDYEFEVSNPFDRGEVVGGFGYLLYDDPRKNQLITMSLEDMMKRKPTSAPHEFWGKWKKEMLYKTLVNYVCNGRHIPLDPDKLDDAYNRQLVHEAVVAKAIAEGELDERRLELIDIGEAVEMLDTGTEMENEESGGIQSQATIMKPDEKTVIEDVPAPLEHEDFTAQMADVFPF